MSMYVKFFISYGIFCVFSYGTACGNHEWTWMYSKVFNQKTKVIHSHTKELLFKQEGINPFSQLLLSWNIVRPEKGYFSFYIQVRDAETKKWGNWYLMADWGSGIQKTYLTKSDGLASCVHVRLELDKAKTADAFCVKIEPHGGARLNEVDSVAVAVSDFNLFTPEEPVFDHLKTVIVSDVPQIAQLALDHVDKTKICSPTSCAMVVQYLTGEPVSMNDFLTAVFDEGLSVYGSWPCNVAHVFDVCKGKVNCFVKRANSFIDLYRYLEKKIPVIVSVRGELPGALKSFPHGHLLVIIGWDQAGMVVCHDPAAESHDMVLKRYPVEAFLRAWERSHRLMYVIQ